MPTSESFAAMLSRLIAERGISKNAFARLVDISTPQLARVSVGKRLPALDALPAWADALALSGEERERFILAGQLAHAPAAVRAYVERLEGQVGRRRR